MTITAIDQVQDQEATIVTATSDLSGTIFYHWYMDGAFIATTEIASYAFYLLDDEQVRIDVIDTNDATFDPIANAPAGFPARRSIVWQPSLEGTARTYDVQQKLGAGAYETIGLIPHRPGTWRYRLLTPRLTDLSSYTWKVDALDAAGEVLGTEELDAETIVRTPDSPEFTVSFDEGTTKVTFTEAA